MTQTHIALMTLQSQLHLAQQQESDLRQERDVCDSEFRAMNAHLTRITIRPQDMNDYEAMLRKRERVADEWRLASRKLIGLQRKLADAGLDQIEMTEFNG
ncbi:MAG: hypothetical protein OJJ21_24040 [Ferrovibrio sp.]|uniref:hypothetical protein n=1 Tax=Ferrovibrio sp. TaxID=1917215 RepID=UPI0026341999|nr:hypothetical protein [Ferrovibrio sp.]MCW0236689.1 hypothetical protein [Ferrovibrio sp.]